MTISPDPLWADLINSDWRDYRGSGAREDRLGNEDWLRRFLTRAGWDGVMPGRGERENLGELRSLLRRMVDALVAGRPVRRADVTKINGILAAAPVISRLDPQESRWRLSQVSTASDFGRVLAAVVLSFASMLSEGDPTRVKICANPDCGWVIYDESHNRTRRWCDVKECGNLVKVRQFRARRSK